MSRTTPSINKAPWILTGLFLLSLSGALLEGLWTAIPAPLVQFNGLVLILSALALLGNGALTASRQLDPVRD